MPQPISPLQEAKPEEPEEIRTQVKEFELIETAEPKPDPTPVSPVKPTPKPVETRSSKSKKQGVSQTSKKITKVTPLEYLTKACKKHPKSMLRLCKLREATKQVRRHAPEAEWSPYKILSSDPYWFEPDSEPIELIEDGSI